MSLNGQQQVMFTVPVRRNAKPKMKVLRKRSGQPDRQVSFAFIAKAEVAQRPAKYTPEQLEELFELF